MLRLYIFLFLLLLNTQVKSLDLTLYVNNWLNEIPETYNVHKDDYINLDSNIDTILSDVLTSKSSFNAVRSGPKGSQTSLFTRGTNSNHTLISINGSPITDHSTSNGLSDLGLIDTSFAGQIHLIDGPMSTLYGANALGGVVDIQTTNGFENKIITTVGSYGEKKINLRNNFGENKNYTIGISYEQTEGISVYPEGEEKDGYNLNSLNFSHNNINDILSYDLTAITTSQNSDLDASGSDDLDYTGKTQFNFFQLNSNMPLENGKLNFVIDYNNWNREYINGNEIDNYYSSSSHIKSSYIYGNNFLNNVIGYDHLVYKADFKNRGSFNSSVNKTATQYGIFNNLDYRFNSKLTASLGYRADHNSFFGTHNTYRAGISFKKNNFIFFNSYSTGYKNPTLYEMHGSNNFGYKGNPDLKPEISLNSEIGFSYNSNLIQGDFSIYDTKIKDMITYANNTYSNDFDDSSSMQGIDLDLNFNLKKIQIINSFAHVHAVDSSNVWLKRRPHDILNSSILYYGKNWSIGGNISYYGKHSDTHSSTYSTILVNDKSIFGLKYNIYNFNFSLENIFNEKFERPHGYNQGGVNAKLRYSINY